MLFSSLQGIIEEGLKQRKERAVQISQSRVRAVLKRLLVLADPTGAYCQLCTSALVGRW